MTLKDSGHSKRQGGAAVDLTNDRGNGDNLARQVDSQVRKTVAEPEHRRFIIMATRHRYRASSEAGFSLQRRLNRIRLQFAYRSLRNCKQLTYRPTDPQTDGPIDWVQGWQQTGLHDNHLPSAIQ